MLLPPPLTVDDLKNKPFPRVPLAVLGHPIGHSISPFMHNAALAAMAKKNPDYTQWSYFKFAIHPDNLKNALSGFHKRRFRGLNLTIPHKTLVLELLSDIEPGARKAGAANTLVWTPQGYRGHNTDGFGLARGVEEDLGIRLSDMPVVLLGAGGAARAAAVQCLEDGCPELWIGNRNQERLNALHNHIEGIAGKTRLRTFTLPHLPSSLPRNILMINATSLGLSSEDPQPVNLGALPAATDARVYDMIYNPERTPLLRQAEQCGIPAANGLSMLIHQGARSLEIWAGEAIPVDAMRQAALDALERKNE